MRLHSLQSKLLLAVFTLVIVSSVSISLLVIQRYSRSIFETARAQAENLAHALALEAADKILINDRVGLQKMLDGQMDSNPAISYLFVVRDNLILAHTFIKGIPQGLISANQPQQIDFGFTKRIVSAQGEHYLDIAWPVFNGKAGILRLGLTEKYYRKELTNLRLQMGFLTLVILMVALAATFYFIRRVTGPLKKLAHAAENIANGDLHIDLEIKSQDEVGKLTASFQHMVRRIQQYTRRLEAQSHRLVKAHDEMQTFCGIIKQIGAQHTLDGVGAFLLRELRTILDRHHMVLFVFSNHHNLLFRLSESGTTAISDPEQVQPIARIFAELDGITLSPEDILKPPLVPDHFPNSSRQTIIPLLARSQIEGALVIGCEPECACEDLELEKVELILEQASGTIKRAVLHEEEIRDLHRQIDMTNEYSGIIGRDPKMQMIYRLIDDIAATDATVLIQGESGTGKELVARAIHRQGLRHHKPFVVINCSAYPSTLLESELFGHEKGAFTGATRQKAGRFELADGGTVFLDEIGEITPSAQIKLLRVLQTRKFERVGGEKTIEVNVRILAATNKDLLREVKAGRFREDLFYRLNVIPIYMPSLRERRNDIPLLVRHFLSKFAVEQQKKIHNIRSEAMRILLDYPWPGNVRELENSIEHAVVLAKGIHIEATYLPSAIQNEGGAGRSSSKPRKTIIENEKQLLTDTLAECGWNKKLAAQQIGISRSTLYNKIRKYRIDKPTIH